MRARQEKRSKRRKVQAYEQLVHISKGDGKMSTTSSFIVKDVTTNFKDFEEEFFNLYRT
ncbi:MAG: N-acetyltransferase, partial [Exiguobacterium chiriqhucha]